MTTNTAFLMMKTGWSRMRSGNFLLQHRDTKMASCGFNHCEEPFFWGIDVYETAYTA
jgi:hypothetical protein